MQAIARPLARAAPRGLRQAAALSTWSAVPAGPPDPILGACHVPGPVFVRRASLVHGSRRAIRICAAGTISGITVESCFAFSQTFTITIPLS